MKKSTLTITALLAFLIGIALHTKVSFLNPTHLLITAGALTFSYLTFSLLSKARSSTRNNIIKLTLLANLFLSLGLARGISTIHHPSPQTVDYYNNTNETITIMGTIAEEPDIRSDKINYTIEPKSILFSAHGSPLPVTSTQLPVSSTYLLISAPKYPAYNYGDHLAIRGQLQTPAKFDTFDYAAYLSRYGIYSVMYRPSIKKTQIGRHLPAYDMETTMGSLESLPAGRIEEVVTGDWGLDWASTTFYTFLLKTKSQFEQAMNRTFPTEPSASFLAGLLMGSRKGIPEQLSADFQTVGLTHIIAISGYNITIIVTLMMAMLKGLGQRLSIIISGITVILFTIFVGASPAVVRACIMGLFALLALSSNRKGNITLTLLLTATLMIGYNPKILLHDVGFQLSFLATMGLIYVSPLLEPYLRWIPDRFALRESLTLTLSAQIMAMPVILLNFQKLSIISPFANILIAGPIIPLAMLFGFLATVTSWIYLPLALFIGFPSFVLLQYIAKMTTLLARIPYASVDITSFTTPFFYIYFIALTAYLFWYWKKRFPEKQLTLLIQNQRSLIKRHAKESIGKISMAELLR